MIGRFITFKDDLHDIETKEDFRVIQKSQPRQGAAGYELLLLTGHGLRRVAVGSPTPGFHFHKDERPGGPVAADQVHLAAARCAKVLVEDLVALPAQIAARKPFAGPPEAMRGVFLRLSR